LTLDVVGDEIRLRLLCQLLDQPFPLLFFLLPRPPGNASSSPPSTLFQRFTRRKWFPWFSAANATGGSIPRSAFPCLSHGRA